MLEDYQKPVPIGTVDDLLLPVTEEPQAFVLAL